MDWEFQATLQLGLLSLSKQLWVLLPAFAAGTLLRSWRQAAAVWLPLALALAVYASLRFGARWIGGGNEGFAVALVIVTLVAVMAGHLTRTAALAVRRLVAS